MQKPSSSKRNRCAWCGNSDPLYIEYHDEEWGVPVTDDQKLFEFIILESAQAGLSWRTVLHKREGYRKAFKNFDPKKVARMTEKDIKQLMRDASIIRNRLKIRSAIKNAQAFLAIQKEWGSFAKYMWSFVNGKPLQSTRKYEKQLPETTDLAIAIAKDLKKRDFSFLGPRVWYAHMQAVGMVNDHVMSCFRYKEIKKLNRIYH